MRLINKFPQTLSTCKCKESLFSAFLGTFNYLRETTGLGLEKDIARHASTNSHTFSQRERMN